MKISGFTIAKNVIKYNYPVLESIQSILPICDEFIVNVGDSQDGTLALIQSLNDPKIKIIRTQWDLAQKPDMLSYQTNLALKECTGDWAFYVQSDEVIHEADWPRLKKVMAESLDDPNVDALRFNWLHFYGSYYRYRIDSGWFQKQERIVRNNKTIRSCRDAFTFERVDGKPLGIKKTNCLLYHYGWVQPAHVMTQRRVNAENIGYVSLNEEERKKDYSYGDLNRFPVYFGTHPKVMKEKIKEHTLSQGDLKTIEQKYWCHPLRLVKARYKTGKRIKTKIN